MHGHNLNEIHRRVAAVGVVPVIAIEDAASALPLADAMLQGGLPLAEITFRTPAAPDVIATIARSRPEMLVGSGTILTVEDAVRSADAGAAFGLAPGFNPTVVGEALRLGFPFSPGIMTPSEIEGALELGVTLMKFFPAGAAGGIKMLSSIATPYLHRGVQFIPTGGVTLANMGDYLSHPLVLAIGGTWIATREDIAAKRWATITENCRAAVTAVASLRSAAHESSQT